MSFFLALYFLFFSSFFSLILFFFVLFSRSYLFVKNRACLLPIALTLMSWGSMNIPCAMKRQCRHSSSKHKTCRYDLLTHHTLSLSTTLTHSHLPKQNATLTYQFIVLSITSNYGHPDFTCVYRFRVHGEPSTEFNAQEAPILDPTS